MSIIAFIIVFGILVVVHEFGHYYFAKRAGVLVREFSVGFGPKIFNHHGKETSYTIRLLPLGGYVRLAGLEEEADLQAGMPVTLELNSAARVAVVNKSKDVDLAQSLPMEVVDFDLVDDLFIEGYVPGQEEAQRYQVERDADVVEEDGTYIQVAPRDRQLQSASPLSQMLINFAGPLNNFILAIFVFIAVAFVQGGVPSGEAQLGEILADSPAASSQLQEGDQILTIEGQPVDSWTALQAQIAQYPGEEIEILYQRGGQEETVQVTPKYVEFEGEDGVETVGQIGVLPPMDQSLGAKLAFGFSETFNLIKSLIQTIGQMVTGQLSIDNLGGPVAIYAITDSAVQAGLRAVLYFAGYLSVNLGLINLLPIPALDGGKILFNLVEAVRGKPVSQEIQTWVTLVGVGLVFLLMILVTWNDIQRFFF